MKQMEQYELILLFSVRDDLYKTCNEAVREILQKLGGQIAKEEDMGERPLAYPIDKQENGHYLFWDIELAGRQVQSLKESLQAHVSVLRFLLLAKQMPKKRSPNKQSSK